MLDLREEAALVQMLVGSDVEAGLDRQRQVCVSLRPLNQCVPLLRLAEFSDELLHFHLVSDPVRWLAPRLSDQLIVAGDLRIPLRERLPGQIRR